MIPRKHTRYAIFAGILGAYVVLVKYNSRINVNLAANATGNNAVTYFVTGIMMFVLLIVTGILLENKCRLILRWVCLCGRHSLLIYLGHMLINKGITASLLLLTNGQMNLVPMENLGPVWVLIFFVVTMLLLTGISLILESPKFCNAK